MMPPTTRRDFLTAAVGAPATLATVAADAAAPDDRGPIIDTHVHFYDPTRPEGVPWPARGDAVLYRPVLPDEWERLVAPLGPAGAIVVEASSWVEDNQWLLDLADRHDAARLPGMLGIVGVVGSLPLGQDGCRDLVDRFARHPRFRGIRVNGDALLAGLDDDAYRGDLGRLADHGLALDVNGGRVFDAVDRAAARFPGLHIVLDHLGNTPISPDGPRPDWRDALGRLAGRPHVTLKVSALVESAAHTMKRPRAPVDPAFYEPWLAAAWQALGDGRLMYGSNWPVSDRALDYAGLFAIVDAFVRRRGPEAERRFYHDTSRAAYRWA